MYIGRTQLLNETQNECTFSHNNDKFDVIFFPQIGALVKVWLVEYREISQSSLGCKARNI